MISKKTFKIAATCTAAAFVVPWILSCGKGILDNEARQNTPAALLAEAMQEYDNGNYSAARVAYKSILDKHPDHVAASVGLAFALHGEAGKSIVDIVGNLIEQNGTPGGGTGINSVVGAVGLAKQPGDDPTSQRAKEYNELSAILSEIINTTDNVATTWTLENLRSKSATLAKFNEAWLTLCNVMPKTTLDNLRTWAYTKPTRTAVFSLEECDGIDTTSTAVLFAVALNTMTQVSVLYQTVLNQDGDEEFDLMSDATDAQGSFPTSDTPLTQYIGALNSALSQLKKVSQKIDSEIMEQTFGQLRLLTQMITAIPGIPDSAKNSLQEIEVQLTSVTDKLDALKARPDQSGTTPTDATASNVRDKAVAAAQDANQKLAGAFPSTGTEAEQTQFTEDRTEACANFDTLAIEMRLTDKPCACLYDSQDSSAANQCCYDDSIDGADPAAERTECCNGLRPELGTAAGSPAAVCESFTPSLAFSLSRSVAPRSIRPSRTANAPTPVAEVHAFESILNQAEAAWRAEVEQALEAN